MLKMGWCIIPFLLGSSVLLCSGRSHALTHQPFEEIPAKSADIFEDEIVERNLEIRNSGSLDGCAMATVDKCYGVSGVVRPGNLIEKMGNIPSIQVCQWFCSYIYGNRCTWFLHDSKTRECNIFKGQLDDFLTTCNEYSYTAYPFFSECTSVFNPSSDNGCYNFRQDYCRYDMDILEHLEHIENITFCQGACQNVPRCNVFTFLRNQQVCKLQFANFNTRVCDIVHGTASPSFQSCLDNNKIPWANVSDDEKGESSLKLSPRVYILMQIFFLIALIMKYISERFIILFSIL